MRMLAAAAVLALWVPGMSAQIDFTSASTTTTTTTSTTTPSSTTVVPHFECARNTTSLEVRCMVAVPSNHFHFKIQVAGGRLPNGYTTGWTDLPANATQASGLYKGLKQLRVNLQPAKWPQLQSFVLLLWQNGAAEAVKKTTVDVALGNSTMATTRPSTASTRERCTDYPERLPDDLLLHGQKMMCTGDSLYFCRARGYEALLTHCRMGCRMCIPMTTAAAAATTTPTRSTTTTTTTTTTLPVPLPECGCQAGTYGMCKNDATGACSGYQDLYTKRCAAHLSKCGLGSNTTIMMCAAKRFGSPRDHFFGPGGQCVSHDSTQGSPNRLVEQVASLRVFEGPGPGRAMYCAGTSADATASSFFLAAQNESCDAYAPTYSARQPGKIRAVYLLTRSEATQQLTLAACVATTTSSRASSFTYLSNAAATCPAPASGASVAKVLFVDPCQPGLQLVFGDATSPPTCTKVANACDSPLLNMCDKQNARCVETKQAHFCFCNDGYEGDGRTCVDVKECKDDSHQCDTESSRCVEATGSHTCQCRPGFSRNEANNGTDCVADCLLKGCHSLDTLSGSTATGRADSRVECVLQSGTASTFECACEPGYGLLNGRCRDVDECKQDENKCSRHASCTNTKGSYECSCFPGYTGDGTTCVADCTYIVDTCDNAATCDRDLGCQCREGWLGDGHTCFNDDECSTGSDDCDIYAQCTVRQRSKCLRAGINLTVMPRTYAHARVSACLRARAKQQFCQRDWHRRKCQEREGVLIKH